MIPLSLPSPSFSLNNLYTILTSVQSDRQSLVFALFNVVQRKKKNKMF